MDGLRNGQDFSGTHFDARFYTMFSENSALIR